MKLKLPVACWCECILQVVGAAVRDRSVKILSEDASAAFTDRNPHEAANEKVLVYIIFTPCSGRPAKLCRGYVRGRPDDASASLNMVRTDLTGVGFAFP